MNRKKENLECTPKGSLGAIKVRERVRTDLYQWIGFFMSFSYLIAVEKMQTNTPTISPDRVIQQRFNRPLLLDRQTIVKTDQTDAFFTVNLGQNKGRLPGSGFQATHQLFPHLKAVYENNLLLPYWAETISSDRYLNQNRLSLEWNLLSKTSLQTSYTGQTEHALNQEKNTLSQSDQKEFGLKGKVLKQSLWETGYRLIETDRNLTKDETNLWYANWNQPVSSKLGFLFQTEYRESGDPSQDQNAEDKRLHLGSGANYRLNDNFSAQLRFDLKMQEELQNATPRWVPEEKRISFSIKGAF